MVQKNEYERENYYRVLGRLGGQRAWKYVRRDYVRFGSKEERQRALLESYEKMTRTGKLPLE